MMLNHMVRASLPETPLKPYSGSFLFVQNGSTLDIYKAADLSLHQSLPNIALASTNLVVAPDGSFFVATARANHQVSLVYMYDGTQYIQVSTFNAKHSALPPNADGVVARGCFSGDSKRFFMSTVENGTSAVRERVTVWKVGPTFTLIASTEYASALASGVGTAKPAVNYDGTLFTKVYPSSGLMVFRISDGTLVRTTAPDNVAIATPPTLGNTGVYDAVWNSSYTKLLYVGLNGQTRIYNSDMTAATIPANLRKPVTVICMYANPQTDGWVILQTQQSSTELTTVNLISPEGTAVYQSYGAQFTLTFNPVSGKVFAPTTKLVLATYDMSSTGLINYAATTMPSSYQTAFPNWIFSSKETTENDTTP